MSNKIVPTIYRAVIDEVIANIKSDFDEYGVSEDVLADLQSKWQAKVMASRVADFEPATAASATPSSQQYPPHPTHPHTPLHYPPPTAHYQPTSYVIPTSSQSHVKSEPSDPRSLLFPQYQLPPPPRPPPGYTTPQTQTQPRPVATSATTTSSAAPTATNRPYSGTTTAPTTNGNGKAPTARIPQVDGPSGQIPQLDGSSSSGSSASPPPSQQYAPHSSHPSLPQPAAKTAEADDEAINSDLDDPDSDGSEDIEDGLGETDIMFCTYDKVARVKNKWKCVLKDGMVHINGRDYLFSKCSGEFEW